MFYNVRPRLLNLLNKLKSNRTVLVPVQPGEKNGMP